MKMRPITLIAFAAAVSALIAWSAFVMFAWNVSSQKGNIISHATNAEAVAERENAALRLHALARDTKTVREELDGLTRAEVLGIADIIEGIGKSAGVGIKINGATPDSSPQSSDAAPDLQSVVFLVEAEGAFSSVMHAVLLFENLPVLSSVQSLELARVGDYAGPAKTKAPLWRLSARIQVMTTVDISS